MALCLHTCQHLTYILPESRTFYCSLSSPPAVAPGTRNVPYNHLEKAVEERAECSWRWFVIAFLDCQESVLPMVKLLSNLLKFCGIFNILPVIFFFFKQNPGPFTGLWARLKTSTCPCAFQILPSYYLYLLSLSLQVMVQTFPQTARFTLPVSLTLLDLCSINSLVEILISPLLTSFC